MRIKPSIDLTSIVLVGNFNAAIFQPAWFALHRMLGQKEAGDVKIDIIHPEVSQFKVDQFELQVLPQRFGITSLDAHPEHVRDLVVSCFGSNLPHTPIRAMGINRSVHFDAGEFEVRDRVGTRLAPKEPWGSWGGEIAEGPREPITARGGMMSIVILQVLRADKLPGYVQTKVEPSAQVPNTGIFVEVNDHFSFIEKEQAVRDASSAIQILEAHWEASLARSAMIVDQIMALTEECRS